MKILRGSRNKEKLLNLNKVTFLGSLSLLMEKFFTKYNVLIQQKDGWIILEGQLPLEAFLKELNIFQERQLFEACCNIRDRSILEDIYLIACDFESSPEDEKKAAELFCFLEDAGHPGAREKTDNYHRWW